MPRRCFWGRAKLFGLFGGVLGAARSVCSHTTEKICSTLGLRGKPSAAALEVDTNTKCSVGNVPLCHSGPRVHTLHRSARKTTEGLRPRTPIGTRSGLFSRRALRTTLAAASAFTILGAAFSRSTTPVAAPSTSLSHLLNGSSDLFSV